MAEPGDREEAARVLEEAECLYTAEQVDEALDRLAEAVTERVGDSDPVFLCVMIGALVPCAALMRRLRFGYLTDYVHATRYRSATRGGELEWLVRPRMDLKDRTVVVVDDILDEGETLAAIVAHCRELGAAEVLSAVLVEKRHDRRRDGVCADFVALEVGDRYIFGCGMDYREYHRGLPAIYAVREQDP